jgi:lipopolysaccharide cholinephosphotransferase
MEQLNQVQRRIWAAEQEILDVIHQVCTEHGLRYSLAYGTLIGAVRHKGFIPWDDDIDIMMPREDYEKLLAVWDQSTPKGYILQNTRTDPDFTQNFTKIRKDHTTFLQGEEERAKQYHKGIFVDIFPGDRVPAGKIGQKMQYIACAVNLLYSRGHTSGTGGVIGKIERILLSAPKERHPIRRERAERWIRRWDQSCSADYVFPNTIECSRRYYPSNLFENMKTIEFNGKRYMCVADPDSILRIEYGDYMQLPPEEDRVWKHHPILIDFEHNYEELTQKQGVKL